MNVTGYSLSAAQSAIAAYFTAVLSRTRLLLFLRNHAPSAGLRFLCGVVPAQPVHSRTDPCQGFVRSPVRSSPTCLTSSRGRRCFSLLQRLIDPNRGPG